MRTAGGQPSNQSLQDYQKNLELMVQQIERQQRTKQNANSPKMSRCEEYDSAQVSSPSLQSLQLSPISNLTTANTTNNQELPSIYSVLGMSGADFAPHRDNWFPPYRYPGSIHNSAPEQINFGLGGSTPSGSNLVNNETCPRKFKCQQTGGMDPPFTFRHQSRVHVNAQLKNRRGSCEVPGCQQRLKRENKIVKHGLVHNSLGYVCAFCPDQHREYQRLDSLQRHICTHHPDKGSIPMQVLTQRHASKTCRQ